MYTGVSATPAPFDLVLLHSRADSYGAHLGVYIGDGLVLHLSRQNDVPAIETLEDLRATERYRHLIGFKSVLKRRQSVAGR